MQTLVPPSIDVVDDSAALDFVPHIPREGIGRDQLLDQFMRAMPRPRPDGGALKQELRSWSGNLGRTNWFGQVYSPTAGLLMKRRRERISDDPTIGTILRSVAELVAPLSRYSAGWGESLAALRPSGVPVVCVREAQRYAVRAVRKEMTDRPAAVHAEVVTLRGFLVRPEARHTRDAHIALCAYSEVLARAADTARITLQTDGDSERDRLTEFLSELAEHLGEPLRREWSAAEMEDFRKRAVAFLSDVVADHFSDKKFDPELMTEAFERVVTTYVNRLRIGKSLSGTEHYLGLRMSAVQMDKWRREGAMQKRETRLVTGDQTGSSRADDRIEGCDSASNDHENASILVSAVRILEEDPANHLGRTLDWETSTAAAILRGGDDPRWSRAQTHNDLRRMILAVWESGRPERARSSSASAGAMRVLLLMQSAIDRARRELDQTFGEGESA